MAVASTASVLGMALHEVETAEPFDIVGELADIIGGHCKGAVSDDSRS